MCVCRISLCVSMKIGIFVVDCMYECLYSSTYLSMHACMYVCIYVCVQYLKNIYFLCSVVAFDSKVKELCSRGIPSNIRGKVWPLLIGNELMVSVCMYACMYVCMYWC